MAATIGLKGGSGTSATIQVNGADRLTIDTSGSISFNNSIITETVYNLTGTLISPLNGSIQYKTLTANTTLTESLANGQSITLMINDGTNYTITWPTMQWIYGSAPVLNSTGYNVIVLWKVDSVLYGAYVGYTG